MWYQLLSLGKTPEALDTEMEEDQQGCTSVQGRSLKSMPDSKNRVPAKRREFVGFDQGEVAVDKARKQSNARARNPPNTFLRRGQRLWPHLG